MGAFTYHKPATVGEAADLAAELHGARFVAGGTDVVVLLKQRKIDPANLISLRNVAELTYIDSADGLSLGSGVTHTRIANHDYIRARYSALADGARVVGSKQIRNVATLGGNICNAAPSADTACPLLALDAAVRILGREGEREVPIDDFFLGPNKVALADGELVLGIKLPATSEKSGSAYIKHSRRQAMELPMVGVAAWVSVSIGGSEERCRGALECEHTPDVIQLLQNEEVVLEDVRIAMGVVAPRPIRAREAEAKLKGQVVSGALFESMGDVAVSECQARDSFRCDAGYRLEMVRVLTKRAILKAIDRIMRPGREADIDLLW
ncbi:MAG: hypothetical protein GXX83_05240 [Gaiellales bacterium]|nr:hypothetical protein [Gaiellales bacterium]